MPDDHGPVGDRLQSLGHDRRRRRERRTARRSHRRARRRRRSPATDRRSEEAARPARSARRASPSRHPRASAAAHHGPASSSGRSGRMQPPTPLSRERCGEPLVPRVEREVVVRHHDQRDRDVEVGDVAARTPIGVAPARERALGRLLDRRAVHHGIGERDADLDRVGTRGGVRRARRRASRRRGRRSCTGRGACGPRRAPRAAVASSGGRLTPSSPEQVHHLRDVLVAAARQVHEHRGCPASSGAARSTHAMACAGSSAGMMPSVLRQHRERLDAPRHR